MHVDLPNIGSTGWMAAVAAGFVTLGVLIRQFVPWRKDKLDADSTLRKDLLARVLDLEQKLDRQQIRHNAERALDRHRLNNVTQCFDALLLLIETAPEKAADAVHRIKEMRNAQLMAEAQEKAILRAAEIQADAKEVDHDGN